MPQSDTQACVTSTITVPPTSIPHTLLLTQPRQGEAGYPTGHVLTSPSPPAQQPPSRRLLQQHSSRVSAAHPRGTLSRCSPAPNAPIPRCQGPPEPHQGSLCSWLSQVCALLLCPGWLLLTGGALAHSCARVQTELHGSPTCSKPAWNQQKWLHLP